MSSSRTALEEVLAQCSSTASWADTPVTDLNQRNWLGDTPLHTVCTWGELEPVKLLIAAGADVNAIGDRGCTPLFNAVMGRNLEVVELLLAAGADPSIASAHGWLAWQYAINLGAGNAMVAALHPSIVREVSNPQRRSDKRRWH